MSQESDANLDAMLTAAMRRRREPMPGFDLAAEARRRGAVRTVPAGLVRWSRFLHWCSAAGILLIIAIVAAGWLGEKPTSTASGLSDESQGLMVESSPSASAETSSIGWLGIAALGAAIAGLALAVTLTPPAPRFDPLVFSGPSAG